MNKAAQKLGRMGKGIPKSFSPAELEKRRARMEAINERKRIKKAEIAKNDLTAV